MKYITLPQNQYISDIEPFKSKGVPTDSIIHKEVPGAGITSYAYEKFKSNLILVVPNVPVIKAKVKSHNEKYPNEKILGVHKGVDVEDIRVYLLKGYTYKKILTTPEGFRKIMKAFEGIEAELFDNYFLLYDECERLITDVSYRGAIAAPIDLFFKFKNKALVSATTLPFSDERFENFDHYYIQPDYDYSKPLNLITTNNLIASVRGYLDRIKSDKVFIFLNSTNGIAAIIKTLGIESESKIFCSTDSVAKLLADKITTASNEFDKDDLAKYNFLTSRYFSAFDIDLKFKPDVLMLTNIFFAKHSMLDPNVECIQIPGRFRKGLNSLTHITATNRHLEVKTQEEARLYLDGCLDTYEHIVQLFKKSKHKGSQDTLKFFVEKSPISNFFTEGKRNMFMIDNDLNEERVRNYYVSADTLKQAYGDVHNHFVISHDNEQYPVGDGDFYNLFKQDNRRDRDRQVAILLDRYTMKIMGYKFLSENLEEQNRALRKAYPKIAKAFDILGLQGLESTGYEPDEITKAIRHANKVNEYAKLAPFVQAAITGNTTPNEEEITIILDSIYKVKGLTRKASAAHVLTYFEGRRSTEKGKNVYALGNPKVLKSYNS